MKTNPISFLVVVCVAVFISACVSTQSRVINEQLWLWEDVNTAGKVHGRHEAGFIAVNDQLYLLGGRRIQPINRLDVNTLNWQNMAPPPVEIHHFQPVVYNNKIYLVGAMTGRYPHETPLSHVLIFDPQLNQWQQGHEIPASRRRGGAGASVHKGNIYITGGITHGHWTGTEPWFDKYNPATGKWQSLPDMPNKRDHFQTAILDDKLVAAGGRISSGKTKQVFSLLVEEVDVFNFTSNSWSTPTNLPTPRAGNSTAAFDKRIWVIGGESHTQPVAHNEVEVLDLSTMQWHRSTPLVRGRHGSAIAIVDSTMWTASGSGNRGGGPELTSTERTKLK